VEQNLPLEADGCQDRQKSFPFMKTEDLLTLTFAGTNLLLRKHNLFFLLFY
jgi:hypothetical protein